ncbi:MAG TPA: alpha/beta fold hydrolase, partial [Burkholderiales bacterium]|nr:alpha/beta fold hydrolase [Burkholderiales bacterium]
RPKMKVGLSVVLLLVAAAFVAVYLDYRRDMDRALERISVGRIAQTPCGPIEYESAGEGEPVLIVHGAGGGIDQGMDAAKGLAAAGFRVIAMSRFGYLRTPLPADASPAAQADAHACLLDALGIKRAAIIGASAGAPSSMQFALRHPERCSALVLLVPAAYVPRPGGAPSLKTPEWTELVFDTALRWDFLYWASIRLAHATLVGAMLATPPEVLEKADADEQARAAQMLEHTLPVSARRLGLVNDARVTLTLPRYDLERIRAPTLAISVADDRFGTYDAARYSAGQIPGARFIGYPTGGHVWIGHHKEIMGEIAAFLARQRDRESQLKSVN